MPRLLFIFSPAFSISLDPTRRFFLHHLRCCPSSLRIGASFSLQMPFSKAGKQWVEKPSSYKQSLSSASAVTDQLGKLSVSGNVGRPHASVSSIQFGSISSGDHAPQKGQKTLWKPRGYSTATGSVAADIQNTASNESDIQHTGAEYIQTPSVEKIGSSLTKLFKGPVGQNFTVDNLTYASAQVRATFYPKFENEKSDQEVRTRMIQMVSNGQATLEVSLKHSGSLFMYAGHEGGAYAKNSFGNIYTAVGVFVLGRMFLEAWGTEARKKQAEFNQYLEKNHMSISMELVTAVLGDHGQRPLQDYVVVTAVTELGKGKPNFYSTPYIIAFCRKWRLPTNHVWLFSTRKSVTSFFAAYDALCEEGTATPVCRALDQVADISVPGSKDHIKVQGEILEGLVARIVSCDSTKHMEKVLLEFPAPPSNGVSHDLGPSLREICARNRLDEKQQIKALLQSIGSSMCPDYSDWFGFGVGDTRSRNADRSVLSKFLQANPSDHSTIKLQEMIRLMRQKRFPAAFKCYNNYHKVASSNDANIYFKMVIHVLSDFAFRRYQNEMRRNAGLWPLYRGFFLDVNLFKVNKERAAEIPKANMLLKSTNGGMIASDTDGLADEDANLMIKLKFLTYKLRTFLIRNGLPILFKEGPAAYRNYYLKQMRIWGTSPAKQRDLSKMLDEWAVYIRRRCGNKQLSFSTYLSEAEPFLEQYAKRSLENQALIGSAGNLVRTEDFMAIVEGGEDEEGDLDPDKAAASTMHSPTAMDIVPKEDGLIIFFPGIPGCAKSALCKEILNAPGGLGDNRPLQSLMGDLIKGRYWQRVADERKRKPYSITLADKNAPNVEVWKQIEDMCRSTRASAVPIIPDSEGTDSNPFSLDALAVFIFRVLHRVNHPGNLDKNSPNAGYVLLMFYHLYEGKTSSGFQSELSDRFGTFVKMPLLKTDRSPLPGPVRSILEEGINLYKLHTIRHGRVDSTKGSYAREWAQWEKRLRDILFGNADYLYSIQVPFEISVQQVLEQLRAIAKGNYARTPSTEKRKFGNIVYVAVTLPVSKIKNLLDKLSLEDAKVKKFLQDKNMDESLKSAHVTLAHKRSHGVTAVASYGVFLNREVPVAFPALLFSDRLAALEASLGTVDGEEIQSKNQWPHVTIWTGEGAAAKDANSLPQLLQEGKATCININPPVTANGVLEFY